mgnify:CR=1 FL=1
MSELGNEAVTVERRGHVMIVTINRPEARNAVNGDVTQGFDAANPTAAMCDAAEGALVDAMADPKATLTTTRIDVEQIGRAHV